MLSDAIAKYLAPIIVFKFCTGTSISYSPNFSIYASTQKSKLTVVNFEHVEYTPKHIIFPCTAQIMLEKLSHSICDLLQAIPELFEMKAILGVLQSFAIYLLVAIL